MAEVRPFRGLRYNGRIAGPLASLLCPPYDVIGAEAQERLRRLSPYNAIHLELPEAGPGNDGSAARYVQAAKTLARWRGEQALMPDAGQSFYVVRHRFRHLGQRQERWEVTARVRLEEFSRGVILPHEETGAAAKEDRLRLLQACQANLSSIMVLYQDAQGYLRSVLAHVMERPVTATTAWEEGQELALWVVAAAEMAEAMERTFAGARLFIADGHHRYETALAYRAERQRQATTTTGREGFNYVMMTLIGFQDPGLLVLPYHRTLGGMDPATFTALRRRLQEVFRIAPLSPAPADAHSLDVTVSRQEDRLAMGLLGPEGEGPYLLTLRQEAARRLAALPGGAALSGAAGWALQEAVLRPALGDSPRHLNYVHDAQEAWDLVRRGKEQMAFFLRPFPLDLFQALVSSGRRLPPKSTYFYPKLPTGLVFNVLEEEAVQGR